MSMRPPLSTRTPMLQTGADPVTESVPFWPPNTAMLFDIVTVPCWRAGMTIWPVPSVVPALL